MAYKTRGASPAEESQAAGLFARKAILWWLPLLYLLIADAFYLRTYDSAQVKITLVQMGGICLLGLWLCRLIGEGRGRIFSKTDLVTLAPFLAYFAYGVFSFLHAPYKFSSLDALLRRIFYMTVPLIIIREFDEPAVNRLTRVLIWTTWICAGYGFLQWFDTSFFPPGVGKGPDPFIWRGAFGDRVFSTFGNPNFFANYLVILFPVLVCQYLKSRTTSLIPLIGLLLWNLYNTQTKASWISFTVSLTLLIGTYVYFFNMEIFKRWWRHIAAGLAVLLMLVFSGIVYKLNRSNWTSVNFRLFTWEGTWEMIMTQPLLGTGIGSFWVIYPAFRRPPIFHIEGKHNTETDHSENEYLEVLYDEGILGFGIFLWLIVSAFVVTYRSLGQLTGGLKSGQRAPPRAYDLLGYLIALQGMLAHNFFDVSMRFVSSGVFLGLLTGLLINLARGYSLVDLHVPAPAPVDPENPGFWRMLSSFLIWPARLAAWAGLGYLLYVLVLHEGGLTEPGRSFAALQGPLYRLSLGGEVLQWWIAWACFLFCVLSQAFIFARVSWLSRNALVPLVVVLMVWPLNLTWGFFRADVHHNIAIFHSKQQNWEQAVRNYLIVGSLNPAFVMSFYFKGNVFNDRLNMAKIYNENWGDRDGRARDDFERAVEAYTQVRERAPNYVQMHHQMGWLHMKRAQWEKDRGKHAEAERYFDKALEYFELYRKHDPVFPANYYRMGQIHIARGHHDKAVETYRALIEARECAVDERLSAKPLLRRTLLAYQGLAQDESGAWRHRHDTSEAYTHLGNAYYLANRLPEAAEAYRQALSRDPNNQHANNNLRVLLGRARSLGRLNILPSEAGKPPVFEITPSK